MMAVTVVVNPSSGAGLAGKMLPEVLAELRKHVRRDIAVWHATGWEDAGERTRIAARQSEALVVIGGDGMAHLGLNACVNTTATLVIIPSGTGNDIARGLGLDVREPLQGIPALARNSFVAIDLMDAGLGTLPKAGETGCERYIGSVVATGFDAIVNQRANRMTRPKGPLRYAVAALAELSQFAPLAYRVTIDGVTRELEAMLIAVGNTAYYGGGMKICPVANPADAILDITIIRAASRTKLLRLLPQMFSGRFIRDSAVELVSGTEVVIEGFRRSRNGTNLGPLLAMGDGERLGRLPQTLKITPAAVKVAVP